MNTSTTLTRSLAIVLLALLSLLTASASALIVNGDFEAGNTGFTSEYTYTPPGPGNLDAENFYTVDTDPRKSSDLLLSIGDHTTGTGLMMIINGSETTGTLKAQFLSEVLQMNKNRRMRR